MSTGAHLAHMFTKSPFNSRLEGLCNKLGLYDMYGYMLQLEGGVRAIIEYNG